MWSITKSQLKNNLKIYTSTELSYFDFTELIVYSVFLYLMGVVGYYQDLKKMLFMACLTFSLAAALSALPGTLNWYHQGWFIFVKILIGFANACVWPPMMTTLGSWFPKQGRGMIIGIWATCNNVGHIGGA